MKYSNQPIEKVALPAVIDFGSPSEASRAPRTLHPFQVNARLLSSNQGSARLGYTLNRPMAKANRALSEFSRHAFG